MPNELGLPEGRKVWITDHRPGAYIVLTNNALSDGKDEGRALTLTELEEWKRAVVEARTRAEKAEEALRGCLTALKQSTHPSAYTVVKGAAMDALAEKEADNA